jgi:hypothetical protein
MGSTDSEYIIILYNASLPTESEFLAVYKYVGT